MTTSITTQQRPWSGRTYNEIVFDNDIIRKRYDIRNAIPEELTIYQRTQLKEIKKQVYELEMYELRKAIFRTFETDRTEDNRIIIPDYTNEDVELD